MPTSAEIFESMPGRFSPSTAGNWETQIQFLITGEGGGDWILEVKNGTCEVRTGKAERPKATVQTDSKTWVGINDKSVNPMVAFAMGKIKVQGDMSQLLKLNDPNVFRKA